MRVTASSVAASLLLAVASVVALASPAPASTGACDGVWVVVDARAAGGSLSTRCAQGDPSSGLAALELAGFPYTFAPRIPGFVCTIDARPDPCNGAPAEAYWSYWHAKAGGSWTYSTAGAGSRDPSPGTVEGWRFGDGSTPPGTAPPANAPDPEPEAPTSADDADDAPAAPARGADSGADSGDGGAASPSSARDRGSNGSVEQAAADGDTAASDGSPGRSDPGADETDESIEPAGEEPDAEEASPGPAWEPPPIETGEWSNPPPADTTTSGPAAAPSPDVGTEPEVATAPADEEEMALATRRRAPGPGSPVGAAVALGLLAGLGALTWRQRVQRSGPRS